MGTIGIRRAALHGDCGNSRLGIANLTVLCLLSAATVVATPAPGLASQQQSEAVVPHTPSTAGERLDLEELATRATAAVVLIDVQLGQKSRQGSGFVVDPDGVIITNYHVIRDATSASVKLSSGDVYDRVLVMATDERRDIAILKISGFGLPVLELGDSDEVRVGTDIVAIGSPMGLENTLSTGIVSGHRKEPKGYRLLQITAPASTGSSGGPVLLRDGRVVGIACSQFRAGQNLNFAVPINYARGMLAQIDGTPVAVLGGTAGSSAQPASDGDEMAASESRVNAGIQFDVGRFEDHRLDLSVQETGGALRRTRVTYRRIDDIAGGEPRIERYLEGTSTLQVDGDDPDGAVRAVRRERRRSIVSANDLAPVSARGEVEWLVDAQWRRTGYDLRFANGRVTGTVTDSAGVVRQVDREVPTGVVLRDLRDLAFGAVVAEQFVGRSVELTTFDAARAELTSDRFDVRSRTTVESEGSTVNALAVDVASGLVNERTYYTIDVPRRLLSRQHAETGAVEEVVGYFVIPAGRADEDADDAP